MVLGHTARTRRYRAVQSPTDQRADTEMTAAVHRLTNKYDDVPIEVMAMDIYRIARTVYNDETVRGNARRRKVIHDRIHEVYPEVPQEKFIAALRYLTTFLHD